MKRKLLVLFLILSLVAVPVVFAGDLSFVTDEADLLFLCRLNDRFG